MPDHPHAVTMNRRKLLRLLGGAALGGLATGCGSGPRDEEPCLEADGPSQHRGQPLNVVFLPVDDLNLHLPIYGQTAVQAPNIDRLARQGVTFSHAYCQFPVCNPSRASFLTGLRPDTTGVHDLTTHFRTVIPEAVALPQHFREHGYRTAERGKIFHLPLDDAPSWDQILYPKVKPTIPITPGFFWEALDEPDEAFVDGASRAAAVEFLEDQPPEPFFLAVGLLKPHQPLSAPRPYFDLYDPALLPLPPATRADWDDLIPQALRDHSGFPHWNGGMRESERRAMLRGYYACTSFMDAQVGRILDALERAGLAERTIVVLLGDNGYHVGEHGLWDKNTLFEESVRVPFVLSHPHRGVQGVTVSRLVELVDLYPTLCDLCGLPIPDRLEGSSLAPLLDQPERCWKAAAFSQVKRGQGMGRSIRTERYRYTRWEWTDEGRELYDHARDPYELTNLARQPRYARVVQQIEDQLQAGWQAAAP